CPPFSEANFLTSRLGQEMLSSFAMRLEGRRDFNPEAMMNLHIKAFLSLLVAAVAMAVPSLAQTVPVTNGSYAAPDFSGMWVHPYFPGIEPPPSGPGPIFNRSRRPNGQGNTGQFVGDYTNPILKPGAAATVKKLGEISLSGMTYGTP